MSVQKNTRGFAELASDIENLSESIAPARRAELMKTIAAEILRRHRARIKANIEPDGMRTWHTVGRKTETNWCGLKDNAGF